jgi:hypothetical protein
VQGCDTISAMNRHIVAIFAACFILAASAGLFAASFDPLLPLLVDIAGWKADKAEGIDFSQAGMQGVSVIREYSSGEKGLSAAIMMGTQAGAQWMPEYKEGFKVESPEGSMEVRKLNGFLVYQAYNIGDSTGGLIVLLLEAAADKPGSGALLVVSFEGVSFDEGLKLAQKFDWKKMKDTAAKVK